MLNIEKSVHYYNYAQQYYMMPKSVVEFLKDNNISLGACDLYMYLRDRYKLSLEKVSKGNEKYKDELGVFCIFTREEMCEITGKNDSTVRRWYNELKKCGLIQYRQVKKEKGQANRFYIQEEQLVDSDVIALYTSEEYKPVVHYAQSGVLKNEQSSTNVDIPMIEGVLKNEQSMSAQKCTPSNNSLLSNNIINTYTSVLEIANTFRCDYVHLKNMEEDKFQTFAYKWHTAYEPSKGANLKTFIRDCMKDLNDRLDGGTKTDDSFTNRLIEKRREKQSAIKKYKNKAGRKELVTDWKEENDREYEELQKEREKAKPKMTPEEQLALFEQATKKANIKERLEKAITTKGYEHPDVVKGVMMLANKDEECTKGHLRELQKRKCLVIGKNSVTYTAEYSEYLKRGNNIPYSVFLELYNPIMSNGKSLAM